MEIGNTARTFFEALPDETAQVKDADAQTRPKEEQRAGFLNAEDTVQVSHNARLMTEAYRVAQESPDARADKIAAIAAKIANGDYKIDAKKIAVSLIRENPDLFKY